MPQPPENDDGISSAARAGSHHAFCNPPRFPPYVNFPVRLYTMVQEADKNGLVNIVSWQPHGRFPS